MSTTSGRRSATAFALTCVVGGLAALPAAAIAKTDACGKFIEPDTGGGGGPAYEHAVIKSGKVSCSKATSVADSYAKLNTYTKSKVQGYTCNSVKQNIAGGGFRVLSQTCTKGKVKVAIVHGA
ncbi:MAG TPA: hypothetical protein VHX88_08170 [Solirubrobacteraceae bacterium]|jgi:hypothetical protein|nr:hypothetical protein [Solirubrobacteraceae bacterium]